MPLTREQLKALRTAAVVDGRNRLRQARELAGLTQIEMTERLGVSQPQLSDWERGRYAITIENARKFAEFFGCAIEDLFPAKSEVA